MVALVLYAIEQGHFDTPDAAIATCFPSLLRASGTRIRADVRAGEDLGSLPATRQGLGDRYRLHQDP